MKIKFISLLSILCLLSGCSDPHEHTYSDKWSFDTTDHWNNANCDHISEVKNKSAHNFNSLGECEVCGYVKNLKEELTKVDDGIYSITFRDDYLEKYLEQGGGDSDLDIYDFAKANISNDTVIDNYLTIRSDYNQGACSSFTCLNEDGEYCHGRSLDFKPKGIVSNTLIMHNIPKYGYESIAFTPVINLGIMNNVDLFQHKEALKAFELIALDGINSAGLVLNMNDVYNPDSYARQDTNKKDLTTTVLNRLLLNKAATVEEAINLIKQYDIHDSDTRDNSYHIMISDKTGDACVIEFYKSELQIIRKKPEDKIFAMCNNELNEHFPVSSWNTESDRYRTIIDTFNQYEGNINKEKAMNILKNVRATTTLHSIVYNNERQTVYLCRNQVWDKQYFFGLKTREIKY